MNKFLTIAALLMLTTLGARASQVNIVVKPTVQAGTEAPGTVTYKITGATNGAGGVCTLTVTPASGYYLTVENLTATTSLDGSGVQAPRRADGIDVYSQTLTITATNTSADPSSVTTYTFDMPTDGSLNVDVTAEFQPLETPSYSVSVTGWTYGGVPNNPQVTGYAGTGTIEYYYKLSSSSTWSAWSGISSLTDAGNYDMKAAVPAYNKYAAAEVTNTFTISKANINKVTINPIDDQTYSGEQLTPEVTVTFNDADVATDEYTVSYEDNVNVGEATVKLTGSGKNFVSGSTTTATFTIVAASLDNAIVKVDENATYSGSEVKPTVTVQLTAGSAALKQNEDYEVAYSNNINAATADATVAPTVTITGIGNYTGSQSVTFTIKPLSLSTGFKVFIDPTREYTYTGEETRPTPTVAPVAGGDALVEDEDFEVISWVNNINAAKADDALAPTITVTGKGNYTGSASGTFTIYPKMLMDDMVTLSSERFESNGSVQKPEVTVADGNWLTEDDYTVKNEGGKTGGTYEVVVTAKRNYTGEVTKTFEIVNRKLKATDVTFSYNWASYYSSDEDIDLPDGIAAYVVTAVGETTATATQISYIPAGVVVLLQEGATTTTTNTSAEGSLMAHASDPVTVESLGGTIYGLYNGKLMRVAVGTIPAGKNYLRVSPSSGAPQLSIVIDGGGTTGIENGKLKIENSDDQESGVWYDLQGRRLQQKPAKSGLYIKNGVKVVINNK